MLNTNTKYFFIGIKGSGMSALAGMMHDMGYNVSGSDVGEFVFSQVNLEERGINFKPFAAENITKDMVIIQGNSFNETHEEVSKALELGLTIYKYHEALHVITGKLNTIGVSGSHGKTTTTSLMVRALNEKCNYIIGDGHGHGSIEENDFILESCEYRNHFSHYNLNYLLVTNFDFDHPDYFKDMEHMLDIFAARINQTNKLAIICGDDQYYKQIKINNFVTYGFAKDNDFVISNYITTEKGIEFDLVEGNVNLHHFKLPFFGEYMAQNAAGVAVTLYKQGYNLAEINENLNSYRFAKRRMETVQIENTVVIDDAAHHPNEITAAIKAVREQYPNKHLVIVHQPHTFSRTKALLNEFSESLLAADEIYITKLYASPRENAQDITEQVLIDITKGSKYIDFEDSELVLEKYDDAVILFVSIGDIWKYKDRLIDHLLKD